MELSHCPLAAELGVLTIIMLGQLAEHLRLETAERVETGQLPRAMVVMGLQVQMAGVLLEAGAAAVAPYIRMTIIPGEAEKAVMGGLVTLQFMAFQKEVNDENCEGF